MTDVTRPGWNHRLPESWDVNPPMAPDDDEIEMTEQELVLAARGERLIAAAMAAPEAQAPARLHARVDRLRVSPRPASRWRRPVWRPRLAGATAALALAGVLAVVVLAGGGTSPTVTQVAAAGRLPALSAPPAPVPHHPARLEAEVEDVYFPNWSTRFGWRATGQRRAEVEGREVRTVAYRRDRDGAGLAYSIVAGDPIGGAPRGRDVRVGTTRYRVASAAGRTTVTWTQGGRTCVIDAPASVAEGELVALASWSQA